VSLAAGGGRRAGAAPSKQRLPALHAPGAAGEDKRAGCWASAAKKECGLHVIEHEGGSAI